MIVIRITESYAYDGVGNLAIVTERDGQIDKFCYDSFNRRVAAEYNTSDSTSPSNYNVCPSPTVTYTWDAGNRLTSATDSSGTITRTWDSLDRLTEESGPTGMIDYTYYANNLRHTMTVSGQSVVTYSYDNANRLTQITQGSATVSFGYDNANRRTSLTLPSGIIATYGYDNSSALTSITYMNGTTTTGNVTYSYNSIGQRTGEGGTLVQVDVPGNLPASDTSYDTANRLQSWGPYTATHDNDGQMNQLSAGGGAYTSNLIWDARHRLTEADDPNNSNAASFVYEYDALNRRIHKKTWDNSGDVAMDVRILNDGWQPVQELNSSLTPTANLLTGLGLDEIFRRTTTSANTANPSATTDYLTDALHSTLALTDTSGTIKTKYSYEPYGATSVYTTGTDTTPSDNTYQYTGRENDQNGLYYYRNRFLLPGVGAFASEDPMGFAAGQNLYLYTKANPINYIDPLGLDEVTSPVYVSLSITGSAAAVVGIALVCGVDPPVGLVLIIEVGGQLMEAGHIYQEGKGVVGPSAK